MSVAGAYAFTEYLQIAHPTVLARIGRAELFELMHAHGYEPHFAVGDDSSLVHQCLAGTLDKALAQGWTGPKFVDGQPVEGTWCAHQVPIAKFTKPEYVKQLEDWLQSYRPHELFDAAGQFREEFAAIAPTGRRRMGFNPRANGGNCCSRWFCRTCTSTRWRCPHRAAPKPRRHACWVASCGECD